MSETPTGCRLFSYIRFTYLLPRTSLKERELQQIAISCKS
nr:MAG TPA: hypothetical protein [Caudoviricetes sp.]